MSEKEMCSFNLSVFKGGHLICLKLSHIYKFTLNVYSICNYVF